MKLVLASKSPRRRQLLEMMNIDFEFRESGYEEDMEAKKNPFELAKFLAMKKGLAIAKYYQDAIIISADTFIFFENEIIGKPESLDHARIILKRFSGKTHKVITGLALINTLTGEQICDTGQAIVKFSKLDNQEIESYLLCGKPMDKAGAYAIQEEAGFFIEKIEGDYYSVMGLPLVKLYQHLKKMGINLLK